MNRLVSSIRGRYAGNRSDILTLFFPFFFLFLGALDRYTPGLCLSRG